VIRRRGCRAGLVVLLTFAGTRALLRGREGRTHGAHVDAASLSTLLLCAAVGAQTLIELGIPVDLPKLGGAVLGLLAKDGAGRA
jgi:hypothetical protein